MSRWSKGYYTGRQIRDATINRLLSGNAVARLYKSGYVMPSLYVFNDKAMGFPWGFPISSVISIFVSANEYYFGAIMFIFIIYLKNFNIIILILILYSIPLCVFTLEYIYSAFKPNVSQSPTTPWLSTIPLPVHLVRVTRTISQQSPSQLAPVATGGIPSMTLY